VVSFHFHIRKIERFVVLRGRAIIEVRRIGTQEKMSFELNGDHPSFVDMPVWVTHNITNIGNEELITLFWINEFFNPDDPDTYYEVV
jgi:UDP-2-acetamido-2,6-beta-L-arabino-hexul-4-ose reductase